MRISLDTETTGLDIKHGCHPFFVTICEENGDLHFWEWEVDPLTRQVQIPKADKREIIQIINQAELIVGQNIKFDLHALNAVGIIPKEGWPWEKIHDTLMSGHLLASDQPHDLTTMVLVYLGLNIKPLEVKLKDAVNEARRLARSKYPEWCIAKAGLAEMPSAGESSTGFDYWLPAALAAAEECPPDHPWRTVLSDYSNADSASTIALFNKHQSLLEEAQLLRIYEERRKLIQVIYEMEEGGVTCNRKHQRELVALYQKESQAAGERCVKIAEAMDYELVLPKSGNNNSLLHFCFGTEEVVECKSCRGLPEPNKKCSRCQGTGETRSRRDWLDLPIISTTEKGKPSLDKTAMDAYEHTLTQGTKAHDFVSSLRFKRKRDTAIQYLVGYERYWLPTDHSAFFRLHPSLNATGTATLRFSSQNPNEQNISKQGMYDGDKKTLRYCFCPLPDEEWWSLDFENIELRIPAYESGEAAMIELFEKPDDAPYFGSYHLLNASIVYPELFKPLANKKGAFKDTYKSTYYQWCKNGGFAIQYGCQEKKADATFKVPGAYKKIKEKMPKIARLNDRMVEHANKFGFVETVPDKTVDPDRGYPVSCSRLAWGKVSPTIPLNYHVQSTAMWCTAKAMRRVHDYFEQIGEGRMVMQVHDEIVIALPKRGKKNLPKVRKVQHLMEQSGDDIGIPLKVSVSYHPANWSEEEKYA